MSRKHKNPPIVETPISCSETSISQEMETLLRWLEAGEVSLIRRDEIHDYLREFPDLVDSIPLAVNAAHKHLPDAKLFLHVYHDPEIADKYMVLCVRLKTYDESVMERIEKAEAEFIDQLSHKKGWLQLTTDFREPEDAL